MICFIFQSYITSVDIILTFTNKYVRNDYRHFLGKVQVLYKNFELNTRVIGLNYPKFAKGGLE